MIAVAPCFACDRGRVGVSLGWTPATFTSPSEEVIHEDDCPFCNGTGDASQVSPDDVEQWSYEDVSELEAEVARRLLGDR